MCFRYTEVTDLMQSQTFGQLSRKYQANGVRAGYFSPDPIDFFVLLLRFQEQ